ncbi:MAG: hypothetical protein ABI430_04255 [Candidatus Taylorbacteria bacterium]
MLKKTLQFFDKLEDKVREALSRRPVVYTLIGGVAIVLFWRGVWMTADLFPFLTGPVSILISVTVLLLTGLFVSFFVGDVIIISGLKKEKKLIEKTESEIKADVTTLKEIKEKIDITQTDVKKDAEILQEIKDEMEEIKESIK